MTNSLSLYTCMCEMGTGLTNKVLQNPKISFGDRRSPKVTIVFHWEQKSYVDSKHERA